MAQLANGLRVRVAEQGQVNAPSYPIATTARDPGKHFCLIQPSFTAVAYQGGYYTWDGSTIASAAQVGAVNAYAGGPITWFILEVLNLAGLIQHIAGNLTFAGSGIQQVDTPIAEVPDYNRAIVIPCCVGICTGGGGNTQGLSHQLTSNTNLRRKTNNNGASPPAFYASCVVIPTR